MGASCPSVWRCCGLSGLPPALGRRKVLLGCLKACPCTRTCLILPNVFCLCVPRLSALLSALDITFASVAPLWVDNIRQVQGPPAHRGYRMYLHRTEAKGGKVSRVVPS